MFNDFAIEVKNLSKTYKLYGSRYHVLGELVHPLRKKYHIKFNALNKVSFQLNQGEVLGIIGRNGSGKSTLLKILASVVSPTSGTFEIKGRYSALLELGGGFNKDMTGIENVYFLGAIQGYSKREMKKRLPQILEFAEIGEYAYQPVKTYSSGMYVRLAFSIAIHIDPDVLIVDEALAVGDIRFQQKCFRRIREFKESGKTILICTHSLSAVNDFCNRAIWLHQGEIQMDGDPKRVTDAYSSFMNSNEASIKVKNHSLPVDETERNDSFPEKLAKNYSSINWVDLRKFEAFGNGKAHLEFAAIMDAQTNKQAGKLKAGQKVRIMIFLQFFSEMLNPGIELQLNDKHGTTVFNVNNYMYRHSLKFKEEPILVAIEFKFPAITNGRYSLSFAVLDRENQKTEYLHWVHDAFIIDVFNSDTQFKHGGLIVIDEFEIKNMDLSIENRSFEHST